MRHRKQRGRLGVAPSHRLAMLRNMTTDLLRHERINTTEAKAKEVRRTSEWMITLAKKGDLHARRQALAYVRDKAVVHKLFDSLAERYTTRQGGYTRITKLGPRLGDAAPMAIIELVDRPVVVDQAEGGKKTVRERLFKRKK